MNKAELIREVAGITGFKQSDVNTVIDAVNQAKVSGLKNDGVVKDGLFTHKIKTTNARTGRNPKTGESIQIESKTKVATKNSSTLVKLIEE